MIEDNVVCCIWSLIMIFMCLAHVSKLVCIFRLRCFSKFWGSYCLLASLLISGWMPSIFVSSIIFALYSVAQSAGFLHYLELSVILVFLNSALSVNNVKTFHVIFAFWFNLITEICLMWFLCVTYGIALEYFYKTQWIR